MFIRRVFIAFTCIVLTFSWCIKGDTQNKDMIYDDFREKINKIESYTYTADITAINDKSQSKYIVKHTYKKPSYYKLEVIAPSNQKGKIIEYYEDKTVIKNPQSEDVIEFPRIGNNKLYLFAGDFIQDYSLRESLKMNFYSDNQLSLERDVPNNISFSKQILYIDRSTKNPEKMELLNIEGEKKFIIKYIDFESN